MRSQKKSFHRALPPFYIQNIIIKLVLSELVKVLQHLSAAELENFHHFLHLCVLHLFYLLFQLQQLWVYQHSFYNSLLMDFYKYWWIFTFTLVILPSVSAFEMGWGFYQWVHTEHLINNPITDTALYLSHPHIPHLTVKISGREKLSQQFNAYNFSQFLTEANGQVRLRSRGYWSDIFIKNISYLQVVVQCENQNCQEQQSKLHQQIKSSIQVKEFCLLVENSFSCNVQNKTLTFSLTLNDGNQPPNFSFSQLQGYYQQNAERFMSNFNINMEPTKLQIIQSALTALISSICVYRYENQYYLGFCEFSRSNKWIYNFKYAPFSIYILADYYYDLAHSIYKDFFQLTQIQFVYPTSQRTQPFPEHVEIFTRFGTIFQMQSQVQLLNFFFVTPMLSQLGTLHEELNYREAKKFHPLLLKMLQQKWDTNPKLQLKGIYEQSFTQDFKFHDYGEKLEQAAAKCAWIYKVVDTFTGLLIKYHSTYMPVEQIKEHLQEHFTLLNIMKIYTNDDASSKTGKYKNIIDVGENLKLYGKYHGYESILPYVYGLGKTYPESTIKQLETNFGLKSSNQEEWQQHEKKYRFRGDIHAYFNLKIITGILYRVGEDKAILPSRKTEIKKNLENLGGLIAKKVISDYRERKQIFTSWTIEGKGRESVEWGKILTALFLKWA